MEFQLFVRVDDARLVTLRSCEAAFNAAELRAPEEMLQYVAELSIQHSFGQRF